MRDSYNKRRVRDAEDKQNTKMLKFAGPTAQGLLDLQFEFWYVVSEPPYRLREHFGSKKVKVDNGR